MCEGIARGGSGEGEAGESYRGGRPENEREGGDMGRKTLPEGEWMAASAEGSVTGEARENVRERKAVPATRMRCGSCFGLKATNSSESQTWSSCVSC